MSKIAFCFPGQGSQRVGMGHELVEAFPEAADVFDRAGRAAGFDVRAVSFDGPLDQLSRTEITQPALMAASLAAYRAVTAGSSLRADVVVGHSVGEYAALAAAGAADLDELFQLVNERGRISAAAGAGGGMAAVLKLEDDRVERLCAQRDDVWPANYNCPGQVVISGRDQGLDAMATVVGDAGGKLIRLKVAGAFHCPLMAEAAARFAPAVDAVTFGELSTSFMSTVTNDVETADRIPATAGAAADGAGAVHPGRPGADRRRRRHVRGAGAGGRSDRAGEAHRPVRARALDLDTRRAVGGTGGDG